MSEDTLGDRMKEYEGVPRAALVRRVPVMMRLDGKAFHTFTRGMERPYCKWFHEVMWGKAKHLCANIQGAQLAYVQSDEISILLTDYASVKTEAWFDYQVQKIINFNDCQVPQKRGVCIVKESYKVEPAAGGAVFRSRWVVDENIPDFRKDRH